MVLRPSSFRKEESGTFASYIGGKTCATYHDEHVPESSIEILGHSVRGITYRHYAHRAPLAFKAKMTLPQPTGLGPMKCC